MYVPLFLIKHFQTRTSKQKCCFKKVSIANIERFFFEWVRHLTKGTNVGTKTDSVTYRFNLHPGGDRQFSVIESLFLHSYALRCLETNLQEG